MAWNKSHEPETYFIKEGFEKYPSEHTLFTKSKEEWKLLIVSIYIDDLIFIGNARLLFDEFKFLMKNLIFTSNARLLFDEFKFLMKNEFDMTDFRRMKCFLGVEMIQNDEGI